MELDQERVKQIKKALNMTWQEIADKGGLNFRQHAYLKYHHKSVRAAEFFGKVFEMNPKDLIK